MPNVMDALQNIGGALCLTPQSLADAHYYSAVQYRCQDAKPLKLAAVPQNYIRNDLSRYRPKFTILYKHMGDILLFNKSFAIEILSNNFISTWNHV